MNSCCNRVSALVRILIITGIVVATGTASQAANVAPFIAHQAIKWQGTVINVEPIAPFYKRRFFNGIWTARKGLTPKGVELVNLLSQSGSDGLEPSDYLSNWPGNADQLTGENLVAAELYLSDAAVRYIRDLHSGRTTPAVSEPDIVIARKKIDNTALLNEMNKSGPAKVAAKLRPSHRQYQAMRKLLASTSDPAARQKIIVNMERWRWVPSNLGKNHILVNVAAFKMHTRSNGKTVDTRRVIVGSEYHKTPMFSSAINHSQFNPTWTISRNIAGNEILPKLRRDPGYLEKRGYDLYASWEPDAPKMNAAQIDWESVNGKKFPYKIVQPPGPDNALGVVKFLFPNKFNVYLHDTANRDLFSGPNRALSHGCIRVEKPMEFANILYQLDKNPAAPKLQAVVDSEKTTAVKFRKEIPVHLAYFTLWVDEAGKVQNFKDVYGRDKLVANLLFGSV
ncbi:MAG: L,D-transpeptidase family protein [Pseudomonadota bacterium]